MFKPVHLEKLYLGNYVPNFEKHIKLRLSEKCVSFIEEFLCFVAPLKFPKTH